MVADVTTEVERCRICGHPQSHHHEAMGCLNRHCRCKNHDAYNRLEEAARSDRRGPRKRA